MTNTHIELFNDSKVQDALREKLKTLKHEDNILDIVYDTLDPKTVVDKNSQKIVIKIDRRKNKDIILDSIRQNISDAIGDDDEMNLLLKIYEEGNEVIIARRRMRY